MYSVDEYPPTPAFKYPTPPATPAPALVADNPSATLPPAEPDPAYAAEAEAAAAAAAEQAAEDAKLWVTVEWRGATFKFPRRRGSWDMNVRFEFEDGNRLRGLCCLLGGGLAGIPEQRAKLNAIAPTADDVDDFIDAMIETINRECE